MVVDNTGMCPLGEEKGGGVPAVTLDPNRFCPQLKSNNKRRCRPIVFLISPKRLLEVGTFLLIGAVSREARWNQSGGGGITDDRVSKLAEAPLCCRSARRPPEHLCLSKPQWAADV